MIFMHKKGPKVKLTDFKIPLMQEYNVYIHFVEAQPNSHELEGANMTIWSEPGSVKGENKSFLPLESSSE